MNDMGRMPDSKTLRHLRVFVSSTFNDMMEERNVLLEKVFPRIASYCHGRKAEFIGVDLRWGVTEEQARRGETVDICMAEIDRSRPLFIGMIGERYGWVPDDSDISVTEQEIIYGALEAPENTEAFFYFRSPELTKALCGPFESDARLERLRSRIRQSGFPVMDGYRDLDSFAERVYTDLLASVDRLTENIPKLSPSMETRLNQRFLAQRYMAGYVERPAEQAELNELTGQNNLVLITGENGSGKTSFLSHWAMEQEKEEDTWLFLSYLGNDGDRGWEQVARQLLSELRERFGPDIPEAEDPEGLRRAVFQGLIIAAGKSHLLLVLDHLDALDLEDSFGLSWLPENLPEGVCIIVSLNDGKALDLLRRRSHAELRLEHLDPDRVCEIARRALAFFSKALSDEQLNMIRNAEPAGNPLYLMTLLHEIRHVGRFELLTEQIRDYLSCTDISALFEKVLSRLDRDYDEGIILPRRLFLLLEASVNGLSEAEILSLLDDLPYARLAPLRLALEPFTTIADSAVQISSIPFREAVIRHYSLNETTLADCRNQLVDWFTAHPETPRRSRVLLCLLRCSKRYDGLYALLSDPACFSELWRRNRYEVRASWAEVSKHGYTPTEGYREVLAAPETLEGSLGIALAEFFLDRGENFGAKQLLTVLTSPSFSSEKIRCMAYGLLGNLQQREGSYASAAECYRRKAELAESLGDRYEEVRALGNLGLLSLTLGDPTAAEKSFQHVLILAKDLNQRDAEQVALGNLGNIAFSRGNIVEARKQYERQRDISRDSGNIAGVINACGALGILHIREKEYADAALEFEAQEAESRRIGASDGLANALGNRAVLARLQGNRTLAEALLHDKLTLCRETGQTLGMQNALGNLAAIRAEQGDLTSALSMANERAALTRRCRAFRQYYEALIQLSQLETLQGMKTEAERHKLEADALGRQHGFTEIKETNDRQQKDD